MNPNAKYAEIDYFFSFQHPFTCLISGPTMSGKTFFVKKLIELTKSHITPMPDETHFYYSEWQPIYNKMKNVQFFNKIPELDEYNGQKKILLIIDDLMVEANNKLGNFYTKGAHHKNLSVVFITQNLYNSNRDQRTINLNAQYLIIFKNPRDMLQIQHLGRSILGRNTNEFESAFRYATQYAYGYLLLDMRQDTPDQFRFMTYILNDHPKNTPTFTHQDVMVLSMHENGL